MDVLFQYFKTFIGYLAYGALAFTVVNVYLTLNKLWRRKHHREVAESVSLGGRFVAILSGLIFMLEFVLRAKWQNLLNMSILIFSEVVQILIGAGVWVMREDKQSLFQLIKQSLKLERRESGDLARLLFFPSHADKIIDILVQVSMIDEVIEPREKKFILAFAEQWHIPVNWKDVETRLIEGGTTYTKLRKDVRSYLDSSPPPEQASQLKELIRVLIEIDEEVTEQEELILDELTGLIKGYVEKGGAKNEFNVVLIPQSETQRHYIETQVADAGQKNSLAGGDVYLVGPFYSLKYAELISEKYRQQNLLSMPVKGNLRTGTYQFFEGNLDAV